MRSIVTRAAPTLLWSMLVRVECHGHKGRQHSRVQIISLTECHERQFSDSSSVAQCSFSDHALAWLKTHPCFAFKGLSRLFAEPRLIPMSSTSA